LAAADVRGPNLHSLDALRGVLAVYVMLGHARWLLWEGHQAWLAQSHSRWSTLLAYASSSLRYGHEAVILFFVLSGYFIHFRWASKATRGEPANFDLRDFGRRRVRRLVPPYVLALLITLLLDAVGRAYFPMLYSATTGDSLLDQNFSRMKISVASVLSAIVMLPSSTGTHFGTDSPLWSIAYECVYYTLYPAWLVLRRRIGAVAYGVGCGVALVAIVAVPQPFVRDVLAMYPLWLAGAALAELTVGQSVSRGWTLAAALAGITGFIGFHFAPGYLVVIPYLALGVGVVTFVAAIPRTMANKPWHRFLEWLGLQSYSIYVFHFPILAFMSAATFSAFGSRPAAGWLAAAGALATLVCCHLLWRVGERNFLPVRFTAENAPPRARAILAASL
jgi:peptidoglycan/LPS O-acetylase OafA/YrhL